MKTDIIYQNRFRFLYEGVEGLVLLALILLSWPLSKIWLSNWGATTSECSKKWPGDILTPSPFKSYTHAIDINTPTQTVWKWVVQLGVYRGGFYSYELFERLAGIPVKNVESILPDFQSLELGSKIILDSKVPGIPIGAMSEGKYICLGQLESTREDSLDPHRSWSIYIEPQGENSCRLLLRTCIEKIQKPTLFKRLSLAFEIPIDFLMEQRMLRTIRRLAENMKS